MELLNKVKSAFIYSNEDMFDDDFRQILKLFYFFGWYQPVPSTTRKIYGFLTVVLINISYLLSLLRDVFAAFNQGRMQKSLISVAASGITVSLIIQLITFMTKETKVVGVIKHFHSLHQGEDDSPLKTRLVTCIRIVKYYRSYIQALWIIVVCLYLCGFKVYKLSAPALYDVYAEGKLFAPLAVISFLHGFSVCSCISASDSLQVILMVRIGANLEILRNKIRCCTDSKDLKENEKILIDCVKYHREIKEEAKKIQTVYVHSYTSIVSGTIMILVCFFFTLMKSSLLDQPMDFVFGFIGLGMSIFQISSLCLIGQWLTDLSVDIFEESFYCKWYEQSPSFKKTLMIFRAICQKEITFGILRFNFSNSLLNNMVSNAFYYYRSMSETMESIGKRSKTDN